MTLDEFIMAKKEQLEKFKTHHEKGAKKFGWSSVATRLHWNSHYEKWQKIYDNWLRECGQDDI